MKQIMVLLVSLVCLTNISGQDLQATQEEGQDNIQLSGYGRGLAFIGGDHYEDDILMSELSLRGELNLRQAYLFSDIRLRAGEAFGTRLSNIQIKELYAGYRGSRLKVALGNQILSWGRTDGFNPNDNLSVSDYFFISPDPDDQKLANFMLRASYRITPMLELELVGIPEYLPSVYRFDLFEMGENMFFDPFATPEKNLENGTIAGRLNLEHTLFGLSVCAFNGYDPFYGFDIDTVNWSTGTPVIHAVPTPYRKTSLGADFDVVAGSFIFRGEAAYNRTVGYENTMSVPNPDLEWVVAVEKPLGAVSVIGQYIGRHVLDFQELTEPRLEDPMDPMAQWNYANQLIYFESTQFNRKLFNQQEEFNHAVSLILSGRFFYDALSVEVAGYYNLTSEEYMVRPKIAWLISDRLKLSLGGSLMGGPEKTTFDYSGTVMNGIFMELKTGF